MDLETSRVLVVDDESFFREAICESLRNASIDCVAADGNEQALELAREPGVGVVVLDVGLPGASGIELLRRLDAERPMLRVIALAAQTDHDLVVEALRLGACDYLAKPLHDEELVLAVRRALQGFGMQSRWETLQSRLSALEECLADLTTPANSSEPVETLETRVVEGVAKVLGASRVSLMLLDDQSGSLQPVAATGPGLTPSEMDVLAVGQGVAGFALLNGEPVVVPNVHEDERFADRIVEGRYHANSFAVVPLCNAGLPMGVLCATERGDDDPFGAADQSLLRILALQIGPMLALSTSAEGAARLDDYSAKTLVTAEAPLDEPDAVDNAELARSICEAVTDEVEPDRLLEATLAAIAKAVRADVASLYLVDREGKELVLEKQYDRAGPMDRPRLSAHAGLTGTVFQTGRLVATDVPDGDSRFAPEIDTPEGGAVGPLLCVPIRVRGKTLGVVRVFPSAGGHASARTGEVLTAAMSAAVRNVLMYRSLLDSVDEVARARRQSGG
jgi:DNA-binding response OmpR family regulator/putative methionine-R-sulfoxide reductase with GAF domain